MPYNMPGTGSAWQSGQRGLANFFCATCMQSPHTAKRRQPGTAANHMDGSKVAEKAKKREMRNKLESTRTRRSSRYSHQMPRPLCASTCPPVSLTCWQAVWRVIMADDTFG